MSLHDALQNHLKDLQELLNEPNERSLLDKAREKWQEHDLRYAVLEQLAADEKFSKPPDPPDPESGKGNENKPVK
ncbi:hypothetical protein BGP_3433 [Beggiatoa sp. PS]|nr:hypothetical protein BGP_3433 [Beggiatoa sp. PS]